MTGTYDIHIPEPSELTAILTRCAERSYEHALQRMGGANPAQQKTKATLHLFDSAWAFQDHMSQHLGGQVGSAPAFFYATKEDHGIAMHTRETPVLDLLTTIQHECLHHAVYDIFEGRLPRWINEGLAQYFQDGFWMNNKLKLGIGDVDRLSRLASIRQGRAGIAELLATPDAGWFEGEHQSGFAVSRLYESSWVAVLALVKGPSENLRKRFFSYLTRLRHPDATHEQAWAEAMKNIEPNQIDRVVTKMLQSIDIHPLTVAVNHMSLLGMILNEMHRQLMRMPKDIEEARRRMGLLGIEVQRRIPGSEPIRRKADDESIYFYETPDGLSTQFDLEPAQGSPPIIHAPLALGQPSLRWYGRGQRIVPWLLVGDAFHEFQPQT